jgi:hypothetical protein
LKKLKISKKNWRKMNENVMEKHKKMRKVGKVVQKYNKV